MILILTYHKVLPDSARDAAFYTVRAGQLSQHIGLLAQNGFEGLSPEDLVDYRPRSRPGYVLTFDDGTKDHVECVLPVLSRYKCRAVFFLPTAKLGRPGYMTLAQARELNQAGHTLGLHSHEHRRLDTLTEEDIRVQMELSQSILEPLIGRPALFFAPPGGFINGRVREMAKEAGVRVTRTMRWGYNRRPDFASLQCIPLNRYFSGDDFANVLKMRSVWAKYAAKQLVKKLLPLAMYEKLRGRDKD